MYFVQIVVFFFFARFVKAVFLLWNMITLILREVFLIIKILLLTDFCSVDPLEWCRVEYFVVSSFLLQKSEQWPNVTSERRAD